MKHTKKTLWLWFSRTSALFFLFAISPTKAQIVPDKTLPINSKIRQQENVTFIEGGTIKGTNLFHSFKKLSVTPNNGIYFNNALGIKNIFTRITGSSVSNINGLIRVNGTANLFFINSNGINFGKNASLDIGGSFFASTASSVKFADDFEFSTVADSSTPLLTISVPIGMGFIGDTRKIQVKGDSSLASQTQLLSSFARGVKPTGLSVKPGKTLGLLGGDLALDGATLTAENGQIELGSVSSDSFVELIPTTRGWTLSYAKANFQDINLSQSTLVDASGVNGGSIQVQGSHIRLKDGSVFLIQNLGTKENENLKVNASKSLELRGSTPSGKIFSSLRTNNLSPRFENLAKKQEFGIGKVADIVVSTKRLSIQEGATIGSATNNPAKSGNIMVNASKSIDLVGFSTLSPLQRSQIFTFTTNIGAAGDVTILTESLNAKDGGFVAASTFGSGNGGNLIIDVNNSIGLAGSRTFLGTRALSTGNAGDVKLNAASLTIQDGASVDTSTFTSGSAGDIFVNTDSINLIGTGELSGKLIPSSISSSVNIPSPRFQKNFGLPATSPDSKSGDVTINAKNLNVTNGAEISVENDGIGDAGIIKINTDALNLATQGKITAATASGEGGNIFLRSRDLRSRLGEITTSAGGTGNGGDITINADTITALKNSGIRANAFEGNGGNIKIKATGLFVSPNSEITATSQKGVDGNIEIDVEESNLGISFKVDPGFRFRKLPLFCGKDSDVVVQPSLVNVGKGSLPFDPEEAFINNLGWHDTSEDGGKNNSSKKIEEKEEEVEVIEAQGWIDNGDGTVSFTASPPDEVIVGDSLLKSMCKID